MALTCREDPTADLFELTVDGSVTQAEFDDVMARLDAFITQQGSIRLLEIVRHFNLSDVTLSMFWEGVKFDIHNLRHIRRAAIVSDIGWISPWTKFAGSLMSTEVRVFPLAELDAARAWLVTEA